MKKLLLLICLCLCVQIGYAQTTHERKLYTVANTCTSTSYPQSKHERQKYFSLAYFKDDTIYINFSEICCYMDVYLVATIDDNHITFSSYELENDDYRGSGTITDDYLSIDYTISYGYSQEISETCHMESIPDKSSAFMIEKSLSNFPNPVKNKLTLSLPKAENEVKIFDLQGKLLLQQNVGFSSEINVSMLPTGMYVLVVNGESYKFVKE